jgi:D-amino-acid dehydrogenase
MRDDPDVLIIGGGIVGLFCAYFLRLGGASVTVVERGTIGDPQSCSYGNTGFVFHGGMPLAEPGALARGLRSWLWPDGHLAIPPTADRHTLGWLVRFRHECATAKASRSRSILMEMKNRSLEILRQLPDALASNVTSSGVIMAYKSADGFTRAARSAVAAADLGVSVRVVSPDELCELEPDAHFDISGALYREPGAFLHAPEFVIALAKVLRGMDVEIRERCEFVGVKRAGPTVARVRTTSGELRPGEVVVAAGVWSAACARMLGIELAIVPVKGYSITVRTPFNAPRHPLLLTEGTVAVRSLDDRLRFAGSLELTGDASQSRRRLNSIIRTVRRHLPRMEIAEARTVWTGLRPCTPDSLPFLGRVGVCANVSVAAGHGHIGMGLAPAGGLLLAQIVRGGPTDMDVTPFRVDRFRSRRG